MTVELFSTALKRRYTAPRCSLAYLFSLGCTVAMVILPFFLAYPSNAGHGGIWLTHDTYREQPEVTYTHKVILTLQAVDANGLGKELFFSSADSVNSLRQQSLRSSILRSREIDYNYDGIMDALKVNILVPIFPGECIYSLEAAIFFKHRLQERAKVDMEIMSFVSHDSGLPGAGFTSNGQLRYRQEHPLAVRNYFTNLYTDQGELWNVYDGSLFIEDSSIRNIVFNKYSKRSFATDYVQRFGSWTRKEGGVGSTEVGNESVPWPQEFNFTWEIEIPTEDIVIIPPLPDVLKDVWIKYLSMLVVVGFVLMKLSDFIFHYQVIGSKVSVDGAAGQCSTEFQRTQSNRRSSTAF